jgi:hypothetical protein
LAKVFCTNLNASLRRRTQHKTNHIEDKEEGRPRSALFVNPEATESYFEQANGLPAPDLNVTSQKHSLGGTMDTFTAKMLHSHFMVLEKQLRCMEVALIDISRALKEKDITRDMREMRLEWQIVALTLDRLFFSLFIIAIFLSLYFLFPKPF